MTEKYRSHNLLVELMKRSRLSWFWTTTVVAVVLILLLVMVVYLEGYLTNGYVSSFWGEYLDAPVTIIYILAIYPFIIRRWVRDPFRQPTGEQGRRSPLSLDTARINPVVAPCPSAGLP